MWIEGKLDIVGAIALGFAILHVSFCICNTAVLEGHLIFNKNLCGRDGRTICGPQCVPKSTSMTLAGRKDVTDGNDNGTDGQTDRQTDGQTECDAICGPLLGRRAA